MTVTIRKMRTADRSGVRQIRYAARNQNGFVAVENRNVSGFLTYRLWKKTAYITWMAVERKSWGKEIGKFLVRKIGFRLLRIDKDFYPQGGNREVLQKDL